MNGLHDEPDDATPITAEERERLLPSHITLRRELNELEQQNILEADLWAFAQNRNPVDEAFVRNLHRRMFGEVWRWAGTYRSSNKNIGIDHTQIQPRLYEMLNNFQYWIDHKTFSADETAVRFHHALVFIHPFPNGNGRWSRMMSDILAVRLGQARLSWGNSSLRTEDETRRRYISALRAADNHDFAALIVFART